MNFDLMTIYIFVVGLLLGSFFNVCIYRIPKGESIVFPPSHCTSCNNRLKAWDLVPIFSYLFLKGKCRYCKEKISPRYAIIEFFTGVIYAGLYIKYGLTFDLLKFILLASFLIIIGMIDYDTTDVYDSTAYAGLAVGVISVAAGYFIMNNSILDYVYGAALAGGIIGILVLIGGMGSGDIEICAMGGLFLGLKGSIVMLFFSFIIGGAIGILLIVTKKKSRKDYIPFGPYIALGAMVAMFFGDIIVKWYLG